MFDGPPLEPGQTKTHSGLEGQTGLQVKMQSNINIIPSVLLFMLHIKDILHLYRCTFSTNLLAAAFSPLIVVSCSGGVMGKGRTSSNRLPAPDTRNTLPLVRKLPLDDTDVLSQSLGSTRLTNAVLP